MAGVLSLLSGGWPGMRSAGLPGAGTAAAGGRPVTAARPQVLSMNRSCGGKGRTLNETRNAEAGASNGGAVRR